jgi:O-antigen ligase
MFDSSIVADASTGTRANMVQIGLELFKKNPILGVGFGNFSYHYYYEYSGWAQTYAHNNYVEILADTGIVGFVLYYIVPFSMLFKMATNWKKYAAYDRKLAAFLITFILIRLVMDYGMVDYDDEFVQILTVNCFAAIRIMDRNILRLHSYSTEET